MFTMEDEKSVKKQQKKEEKQAVKRIYHMSLKQVKRRYWILSFLACILLSFLLVYGTWQAKEKQKVLLFEDPDAIYEQYELAKKDENNPNPAIQTKLLKSYQKVIELETAKKYNIVYQQDERVSSLEQYAKLKIRFERETDLVKKESLQEELKLLEEDLSLTIQERAQKEAEKHEAILDELRKQYIEQNYDLAKLPIELNNQLLNEQKIINLYRVLVDKPIDQFHPMYAPIKYKIKLTIEDIVIKTLEEFEHDPSLYTKYANYEEYWKEMKEKESDWIMEDNFVNSNWAPSSIEWGHPQVYTYQDGFLTIGIYGMIVTLCFIIGITTYFYKDYKNGTIKQYLIHVNSKAYLKGKVKAATLMLVLFLSIGYILIPFFSSLFVHSNTEIPTYLQFLIKVCDSWLTCGSDLQNIMILSLYIYFDQLLIGILYIYLLNAISLLKPSKSILYLVTLLLVGLGIFGAPLYVKYHWPFMMFIPMTYLNYHYLLEHRVYFFLRGFLFLCILVPILIKFLRKKK